MRPRRGVDLVRRADLHELARAHDSDAVAHDHRLFEAVGDVDEGLAGLPVNVLELLLERLSQLVVDCRERLVEEQDLGIVGEGASKRDALALAARALLHALRIVGFGKPELAQERERARLALSGLDAADLHGELDVLADAAMREQGERLEHHAGRPLVGRHVVDTRLPRKQDVARGRRLHAGQHADQRCLAAA